MADYRAKNRNTKAVDVARVRAAAKFSTPAPKVNPNVVAQKPKISKEYSAALREQAQRGVAGARGGSYFDRSQYGSEAIFDPATGISGAVGLATTDYNPEGIKYPTRMVPAGARGGGMVSGGQPNIGSSFSGILEAIKGMATPPPTTQFDAAMQDKYKNNPRAIGAALQRLSPEEEYQMTNQRENAKREGEYSNLLRTLKAAGLTEEELYRSAVASPDGKINLNANAQAIIGQLGNAADSLRLLDVAGVGAGKVAGVGARAVGRTVGRAVEDVAVRGFPIPVPATVGGGMPIMRVGGSANKAKRSSLIPAENTATGSVTEGVQRKVKAVYDEVMSFPKNIPGHEDLAGKSFEDVMNIANNTQDTELINLTNTLYREQNAMAPLMVLDAAQSVSTGAPATLGKALTQKNLGWMAKHIDPTDVSTHTLSYFTKTKDELKQHMFGTLRGGAARAGLGSEALEFKRWQDIPDDALEKALSGWDGNFHGVVDSNGNKVPSLSLAWDHIDSLYNGGENTARNLQAMVQYINASLGAKTK